MTNEQKIVKDWMSSFGQETPTKPTIPSLEIRRLRAKLILEEAEETIRALGFRIEFDLHENSSNDFLVEHNEPEHITLENISDGCSDLKVVTEGTLVACGLCQPPKRLSIDELDKILNEPYNPKVMVNKANADPLFDEVMRSNWTKLWTTDDVNKRGVVTDGDSNAFDATAIIAEDTLCDEDGNTYKAIHKKGETGHRYKDGSWLVKDKDGKVIKSPSYSPANLQPIIDAL